MTKYDNPDDAIISYLATGKITAEQQKSVSTCLHNKKQKGIKIDDQAVAICISEAKKGSHSHMAVGAHDVSRPDSQFAYVPKGKPKSDRKLPIYDAAHVRNALARLGQTQGIPSHEKPRVKAKICAAAKRLGVDSKLCKESKSVNNEISVIPVNRPSLEL